MRLIPVKSFLAAVLGCVLPVSSIAAGVEALGLNYGKNGWLPGQTLTSVWSGGAYDQAAASVNVFDGEGRLSSVVSNENGKTAKTTYSYNADGRIAEIIVSAGASEEELENNSRVVMDYDAVVKDFRTLYEVYEWLGGEWSKIEHESYDVTRDGKGRVSEVSYLYGVEDVDYPEDMTMELLMITYNTDGLPKTVQHYEGVYDEDFEEWDWEEDEGYNDCQWEKSDCQILTIADVCNRNNHLLSATYTTMEGKDYAAATVTWENETDYTRKLDVFMVSDSKMERSHSYKSYANGGYDIIDYEATSNKYYDESSEKIHSVRFDDYGIMTLDRQTAAYDGEEATIKSCVETTVTYDEAKGYPVEALTSVWSKADKGMVAESKTEWTAFAPETRIARFADDFLTYFDGITPSVWEVEIIEDASTPGVYTILNPYGNGNCPFVEANAGKPMIIDASNPDAVILRKGGSGLKFNEALGEMGWSSAPEYLLEKGNSLEDIIAAGYCGTLADGVITFPLKSVYLTFATYPDMRIPRNLEGDFRIILPEGKDYFVKINSEYCTANGLIDYTFTTGADVAEAKYAVFPHPVYFAPENYADLMENAEDLPLDNKTGEIDIASLKRLDGSDATQASVCIFVIDPATGKAVGGSSALFHYVRAEAGKWEAVGEGKFRDDITTYYSDVVSKVYDVVVERNIENPGLVRVVNPFANYTGISGFDSAREHVGTHDHYMIFDITEPDKVRVIESPLGIELGRGTMVLTSVLNSSGEEITGKLVDGSITFPEKGLGVYEAGAYTEMYHVNKSGSFKLRLPDMTGIDAVGADGSGVAEVYDLTGRRLDRAASGINIIRRTDGSVSKEVRLR